MPEAPRTAETAVCPGCQVEVPLDRMADVEVPGGPVSLCLGCHPDPQEVARDPV